MRMVTPVRLDSPANTLQAVPLTQLTQVELLFGDGDPKLTLISG